MRSYTVLAPPLSRQDGAPEALRLVFVKDGFCWPALILPLPWMLFRGLFVEAALYVLVMAGFGLLPADLELPAGLLVLAIALSLGLVGNDIRRFALARRGWRLVGAASGRSIDEAEIRYFLNRPPEAEAVPPAPPARVVPATAGPVIGLFPTAEGTR